MIVLRCNILSGRGFDFHPRFISLACSAPFAHRLFTSRSAQRYTRRSELISAEIRNSWRSSCQCTVYGLRNSSGTICDQSVTVTSLVHPHPQPLQGFVCILNGSLRDSRWGHTVYCPSIGCNFQRREFRSVIVPERFLVEERVHQVSHYHWPPAWFPSWCVAAYDIKLPSARQYLRSTNTPRV